MFIDGLFCVRHYFNCFKFIMHLISQELCAMGARPQEVKLFAEIARKLQSWNSNSGSITHALNYHANLCLILRIINVIIY